jgi:hypothetical protein
MLSSALFKILVCFGVTTVFSPEGTNNCRRWVARNFTVWRTHTRTLIIFSHALSHRTSFFCDRTRTRTRTFSYPDTVKLGAVDWSTIQFLTIFGVLLLNQDVLLLPCPANEYIKSCINSFQSLWITLYIYFSYQNVGSSRIPIRFFSIFMYENAFAWKRISLY